MAATQIERARDEGSSFGATISESTCQEHEQIHPSHGLFEILNKSLVVPVD